MRFLNSTKIIFVLFFFCMCVKVSNAQQDWFWQNPLPQGNTLYSVDFGDENTGWAVGEYGTILISTDGAETWNVQNSGTMARFHTVQAVDENIVYALDVFGTVYEYLFGYWYPKNNGFLTGINRGYFVNLNSGWYVGNYGQIYKTSNAGVDWSPQVSGTTVDLFGVHFTDSDSGRAVGSDSTILMTKNGGLEWGFDNFLNERMTANFTYYHKRTVDAIFSRDISVAVGSPGAILVEEIILGNLINYNIHNFGNLSLKNVRIISDGTIITVGNNGCILISHDYGETFVTDYLPGLHNLEGIDIWDWPEPNKNGNPGNQTISDTKIILVGQYGLIAKSTNGGTNWSTKSSGVTRNINSIFNTGSKVWAAGIFSGGGSILYSSDGGSSWENRHPGTTSQLYSINFTDENTGWAVGSSGTIRKTTNGGTNWLPQTGGTGTLYSVDFVNTSKGWISGSSGTIRHTTNGGESWSPQTSNTVNALYSVSFADENYGWITGAGGTILRTTDGGTTWTSQTSGTTNTLRSVSAVNQNTAYAVGLFDAIIKTTDGGINWIPQTSGTTNSYRTVSFVNENSGWAAGFNGAVLRTTNGGSQWMVLSSGTGNNLNAVFFGDANTGWIAGDGGAILKTITGGGTVSISLNSNVIPDKFLLHQNYPNPFNPVTKINFDLPFSSNVTMKVFDITGREIATLVNDFRQAGSYIVTFEAGSISSGVYFYRIEAREFVQTKRMVLLK